MNKKYTFRVGDVFRLRPTNTPKGYFELTIVEIKEEDKYPYQCIEIYNNRIQKITYAYTYEDLAHNFLSSKNAEYIPAKAKVIDEELKRLIK